MITPSVSRSFGDYPDTLVDAPVGTRVQISPGCDLWARGARYGVITGAKIDKHGRKVVSVRMDNKAVKRLQWFFPIDLTVTR